MINILYESHKENFFFKIDSLSLSHTLFSHSHSLFLACRSREVPGPNVYEPDFMGRSPSMHSSSSNALAYVTEKLSYLGKEVVVGGNGGKGRRVRRGTNSKYDARGLSYDRMKMEAAARRRRGRKKKEEESESSVESDVSSSSSSIISSSSSLPTLLVTHSNSPNPTSFTQELTYHEKRRRPRTKSRHGLEEQEWFQHGSAPHLKEDLVAHQLSGHAHTSGNMKKAEKEKKRLKIDTIKLGNVFFKTSPTKLKPKDEEWQKRLNDT